jgi:hypothetical protein
MSQATKRNTANIVNFKSAPRHTNVVVPAHLADELAEMCTLVTYSDGFTFSEEMSAICKAIADRASPAARRACVARAAERERAYVTR